MQLGLIGSVLVKAILLKNEISKLNTKLILLVRNQEEAEKIFGKSEQIMYIVSDITEYIAQNLEIDNLNFLLKNLLRQ